MPPRNAIPMIPRSAGEIGSVLEAMKQSIEKINGGRGGRLVKLSSNATLEQTISKINEIIDRINV
jgi:ureidoglycolate hydrolase